MEKYKLEDILTLTKSLATLYINGTLESSNKSVRKCLDDGLTDVLKLQEELYQTMSEDGYYTIANISETTINKTLTKLTKDTSE